jgi:DNA replication and repair protein RecF
MSELDRKRRACLIGEISSFQTFITCADREDVDLTKVNKAWRVAATDGEGELFHVKQ